MSTVRIYYLALVFGSAAAFSLTLAYQAWKYNHHK